MSEKHTRDEDDSERLRRMRHERGLAILERIGIERYVTVQTEGTDPATWWPSGVKPGQLSEAVFQTCAYVAGTTRAPESESTHGITRCH